MPSSVATADSATGCPTTAFRAGAPATISFGGVLLLMKLAPPPLPPAPWLFMITMLSV